MLYILLAPGSRALMLRKGAVYLLLGHFQQEEADTVSCSISSAQVSVDST